jgi:Zn-dependent M28 family amino/carboxypeptidase
MSWADGPERLPAAGAARSPAGAARRAFGRGRAGVWAAATLAAAALAGCGPREPAPPAASAPAAPAAAGAAALALPVGAAQAQEAITADAIKNVVAEIADDRYAGRAPGTPGDRMTRSYLAAALDKLGFEPGGPGGGYEQPVELIGVSSAVPATWRFTSERGPVDLARNTDFVAVSGVQAPRAEIDNAELVFVGYGIEAPEYQWDDFKGADLSGKVLVMLNNDPDWDPDLFAGAERLYYGRWTYKYESAARHGAIGAIIIHTTPSAGYPWQVVQSSWGGEQFHLPAAGEPSLAIEAWVTDDAAKRLVGTDRDLATLVEQAKRRDFKPVPLGVTTSLTLTNTLSRTPTANVLGVWHGGDPALADQVVIYTAHHDHFGVGAPNPRGDPQDRIYNGARDNASGVGMVLAIGRAFAALPVRPRRSVMLLFPAAEEQGLLGSLYFAAHPTVPPGKIAADVNYDSGNIWGATRDITFIGLGKSSLDAVAMDVAAYQGRTLKGDQFPDRGSYYRSDQFSLAKIGVPAFDFSGGTDFIGRPAGWGVERIEAYTEHNYHQPSDELTPDWNFDGMVQDAQFGFLAGLIVADAPSLPKWNPGNEFEAARRQAIAAAAR